MVSIPIFDGHCDVLWRLADAPAEAVERFHRSGGLRHFDLPRARAGGVVGGFFASFVPSAPTSNTPAAGPLPAAERGRNPSAHLAPSLATDAALTGTRAQLGIAHALAAAGALRLVRTSADLDPPGDGEGALAAVLHLEGAEACGADLDHLDELVEAGVRSIGITWSRPNAFGVGVPLRCRHNPDIGPGLTAAGRALVRACEQRGVLVDLAHLNEAGLHDACRVAGGPLIVSHSAAFALAPTARNLTDAAIDAIGRSGGIVGLTFNVGDLRTDLARDPATPLAVLVEHIRYLVERLGIEHVAFGSDFEGGLMPDALADVGVYGRLTEALRSAGFEETEVAQLASGNWRRLLVQLLPS